MHNPGLGQGGLPVKAENYNSETRQIEGTTVKVTTYKIGERYFCHIANIDPGATIARSEGGSLEEALGVALEKATARLQATGRSMERGSPA